MPRRTARARRSCRQARSYEYCQTALEGARLVAKPFCRAYPPPIFPSTRLPVSNSGSIFHEAKETASPFWVLCVAAKAARVPPLWEGTSSCQRSSVYWSPAAPNCPPVAAVKKCKSPGSTDCRKAATHLFASTRAPPAGTRCGLPFGPPPQRAKGVTARARARHHLFQCRRWNSFVAQIGLRHRRRLRAHILRWHQSGVVTE
jgi:hypothetical protein